MDDADNPWVTVVGQAMRYYDVTDADTERMTADEYNAFATITATYGDVDTYT